VQASCELSRNEISIYIRTIIAYGIVVLQPRVKLESQQASIDLIARDFCDSVNTQKQVASW